ncbi:MAG: penicillin acylase family protein [Polyangiaceae bacterium]
MRALRLFASCAALLLAIASNGCDDEAVPPANSGGPGSGSGASGGSGGAPSGPTIPELTAPVAATYDEHGLLHLACAADNDCFASLGYFHAQNRFFFMDFIRNVVRGRLGALVSAGDTVLQQDYQNRQFFSTKEGEPLAEAFAANASEQVRGHFEAYTRGVNAWIADMRAGANGATLTREYEFKLVVKDAIRDWEPEDSAAVGLYVLNDLSNNSGSELEMAEAYPLFPAALAPDLFSPQPVFDAFTVVAANQASLQAPPGWGDQGRSASPGGGAPASLGPLLASARRNTALIGSGGGIRNAGDVGSNNWAVAPQRTSGGKAILANDPHLLLSNPSIWFPVEIDGKSAGQGGVYHVAGSTFPGLPSIMIGANESIAWGVTTAYWDLADVYVETLSADGKSVLLDGDEVPIIEKELSFDDVSTGTPIKKSFRWVPHHGPIVSEDLDAGTALSIRWRGHDAGPDIDVFFGLARAASVAEAKEAVSMTSSASQNFLVADKDGHIGWYPFVKMPSRPWAAEHVPWLPIPGDGSAEWGDPVPLEELPQLTDPPAGAIATANADMTGSSADGDLLNDGDTAIQAYSKAEGAREQRILDLLAASGNDHTRETLLAIQGDTYSLLGELVVPPLLAAAETATLDADTQAVVDALSTWQLTCPTGLDGSGPETAGDDPDPAVAAEAIGCSAFHAAFFSLAQLAVGDEVTAAGASVSSGWRFQLVLRSIKEPDAIESGDLFWDDVSTTDTTETRAQIMVAALQLAATHLAVSGGPDDWRWGRLHTLSLRSIYDNFGITTYNSPAVAAPGGLSTVNVASPNTRTVPAAGKPWDFGFSAGPSLRMVTEIGADGPRILYQLPGGADLHDDSQFYNNLLPKWLVNEPIEFPFGPDAVTTPAVEITVSPATP